MKIIIAILILASLVGGCYFLTRYIATEKQSNQSSDYISITALCNGEKQCVYNGRELNVNIIITNTSTETIKLPVDYLQKLGPSISLYNADTEKTYNLIQGPNDQSLLANQNTLTPSQTARISWVISVYDIRQVAGDAVNITANVRLSTPVYLQNEVSQEASTASFNITH